MYACQADTRYDFKLMRWMWILLFTTFFGVFPCASRLFYVRFICWFHSTIVQQANAIFYYDKIFPFIFHSLKTRAPIVYTKRLRNHMFWGGFRQIVNRFVLRGTFNVTHRTNFDSREEMDRGVDTHQIEKCFSLLSIAYLSREMWEEKQRNEQRNIEILFTTMSLISFIVSLYFDSSTNKKIPLPID